MHIWNWKAHIEQITLLMHKNNVGASQITVTQIIKLRQNKKNHYADDII